MNKKYIKLLIALIGIFAFCFICFIFIAKVNRKTISNTNPSTITTTKQNNNNEKWVMPQGSANKVYIYGYEDIIVGITENEESYIKDDLNYKVLASYDCKEIDCKAYGSYYKKNYIIIKDDGYYIYNYKKNKALKLKLPDALYNTINFLGYADDIYGLSISNINDLYSCYSLEDEKFITMFKYSMINNYDNISFVNDRFIASAINNNKEKYYVVDMKNGKELWEVDEPLISFGNGKHIYFGKEYGDGLVSSIEIYNDKYKKISDNKYNLYGVDKNGNLAVIDKVGIFSLYNKEGKLIKNSKLYKEIGIIFNDYIAVIDTDNYLKLVDYDGNVVANFVKLESDYTFYPSLAYEEISKDKKIIYLPVENKKLKAGEKGKWLLYSYNSKTKEKDIIQASNFN